jgi:hypothetical protein
MWFICLNHQRHSEYNITKDIQSNNNNNIVLSMLYAEICPTFRRHNALPFIIFFGDGSVHILSYDPQRHELFAIYKIITSYCTCRMFMYYNMSQD